MCRFKWCGRPANSTRIRESILVTFGYENQSPPLYCIQTDSVSIRNLKRICIPVWISIVIKSMWMCTQIGTENTICIIAHFYRLKYSRDWRFIWRTVCVLKQLCGTVYTQELFTTHTTWKPAACARYISFPYSWSRFNLEYYILIWAPLYTLLILKYKVNLLNVPLSSVLHQNACEILTATGNM